MGLITLIGLGFKKIINNLFVFTKKIFTLQLLKFGMSYGMNNPVKYFIVLKHLLLWGDASFFARFWSVWWKGNYELGITNYE